MTKPTATIGRTERVSLPKLSIYDVPAKIDTGADSSAIWATEIVEHDGVLSFVLFDQTSPYYTGERIMTDEFTVITVKNSFGTVEKRYKVGITMRLGGKLLRTKCNLADRSSHRYPILIGNATIRNKFLVDVSARHATPRHGNLRILVLASALGEKTERLKEGLDDMLGENEEVIVSSYANLIYEIKDGHLRITETTSGYDIAAFDLVYFRTYIKFASLASAAAEYLEARRTLFIDREVANHHAVTKLTQAVRLSLAKLPVPDSVYASHAYYREHYSELVRQLGEPFVLKDVNAEQGRNNHLVHTEEELRAHLADGPDIMYIAQRFSPNNGDLRVLVFDKDVALIMGRRASTGSHLNNTSQGGTSELLPRSAIDGPTSAMCVRAAVAMNRQVAGVDILFDTTAKKWYILEVNNSPQISSGTFVDEKIAAFGKFLKRYSKK
ncbi:MAG TPA: RimK/LysX family protein [Candidatus Saccharimonadales bacterium]|nr:RimK/LysX family protein [Candidatus Saccharimonadales bacterium]